MARGIKICDSTSPVNLFQVVLDSVFALLTLRIFSFTDCLLAYYLRSVELPSRFGRALNV